jgi:hypothetical protein
MRQENIGKRVGKIILKETAQTGFMLFLIVRSLFKRIKFQP